MAIITSGLLSLGGNDSYGSIGSITSEADVVNGGFVIQWSMPKTSLAITVSNPGVGNRYYIDAAGPAPTINLIEGNTYVFDQSSATNAGHPLRFSTTSNGTHGGGIEYTTGVTSVGSPGSAGAYTQITVAIGAPALYYYCINHSAMGGQLTTDTAATNSQYGFKLNLLDGLGYISFDNTNSNTGFSTVAGNHQATSMNSIFTQALTALGITLGSVTNPIGQAVGFTDYGVGLRIAIDDGEPITTYLKTERLADVGGASTYKIEIAAKRSAYTDWFIGNELVKDEYTGAGATTISTGGFKFRSTIGNSSFSSHTASLPTKFGLQNFTPVYVVTKETSIQGEYGRNLAGENIKLSDYFAGSGSVPLQGSITLNVVDSGVNQQISPGLGVTTLQRTATGTGSGSTATQIFDNFGDSVCTITAAGTISGTGGGNGSAAGFNASYTSTFNVDRMHWYGQYDGNNMSFSSGNINTAQRVFPPNCSTSTGTIITTPSVSMSTTSNGRATGGTPTRAWNAGHSGVASFTAYFPFHNKIWTLSRGGAYYGYSNATGYLINISATSKSNVIQTTDIHPNWHIPFGSISNGNRSAFWNLTSGSASQSINRYSNSSGTGLDSESHKFGLPIGSSNAAWSFNADGIFKFFGVNTTSDAVNFTTGGGGTSGVEVPANSSNVFLDEKIGTYYTDSAAWHPNHTVSVPSGEATFKTYDSNHVVNDDFFNDSSLLIDIKERIISATGTTSTTGILDNFGDSAGDVSLSTITTSASATASYGLSVNSAWTFMYPGQYNNSYYDRIQQDNGQGADILPSGRSFANGGIIRISGLGAHSSTGGVGGTAGVGNTGGGYYFSFRGSASSTTSSAGANLTQVVLFFPFEGKVFTFNRGTHWYTYGNPAAAYTYTISGGSLNVATISGLNPIWDQPDRNGLNTAGKEKYFAFETGGRTLASTTGGSLPRGSSWSLNAQGLYEVTAKNTIIGEQVVLMDGEYISSQMTFLNSNDSAVVGQHVGDYDAANDSFNVNLIIGAIGGGGNREISYTAEASDIDFYNNGELLIDIEERKVETVNSISTLSTPQTYVDNFGDTVATLEYMNLSTSYGPSTTYGGTLGDHYAQYTTGTNPQTRVYFAGTKSNFFPRGRSSGRGEILLINPPSALTAFRAYTYGRSFSFFDSMLDIHWRPQSVTSIKILFPKDGLVYTISRGSYGGTSSNAVMYSAVVTGSSANVIKISDIHERWRSNPDEILDQNSSDLISRINKRRARNRYMFNLRVENETLFMGRSQGEIPHWGTYPAAGTVYNTNTNQRYQEYMNFDDYGPNTTFNQGYGTSAQSVSGFNLDYLKMYTEFRQWEGSRGPDYFYWGNTPAAENDHLPVYPYSYYLPVNSTSNNFKLKAQGSFRVKAKNTVNDENSVFVDGTAFSLNANDSAVIADTIGVPYHNNIDSNFSPLVNIKGIIIGSQVTAAQNEILRMSDFYGTGTESPVYRPALAFVSASGGTITEVGNYRIHTFTSSGNLVVNTLSASGTSTIEYLIVAGGGSGGGGQHNTTGGGGGGAGGMLEGSYNAALGSIAITVGAGGAGQTGYSGTRGPGADSVIYAASGTLTALGGGDGGSYANIANSGGSAGGGGGHWNGNSQGGSGTAGQGNNGGGSQPWGTAYSMGGGGGASAVGGDAIGTDTGGDGGKGKVSSISGSIVRYAGGGGGGGLTSGGSGGSGGGGSGAQAGYNGTSAGANTGGGGGGAMATTATQTGGNGGSGIVIVRYLFR